MSNQSQSSWSLSDIAEYLQAELQGDPAARITGIAPLARAESHQLSFVRDKKYLADLPTTQAGAVMLTRADATTYAGNKLLVADPSVGFAKLAQLFFKLPKQAVGVHLTAVIGEQCIIHETASIGAHCVLGEHVTIGAHTVLHPGCVLGDRVSIGEHCHLWANVTIYYKTIIKQRVMIHSGAVIGADGFGLANDHGRWLKIPQAGRVIIEDDVEIGANTTIDRGALDNTVIEEGVKIDNQVQIAHNVRIGAHTAIAALSGIAGSSTIGRHCLLGGQVGIKDHVDIGDQVILTAGSHVGDRIDKPGVYASGFRVLPHLQWHRVVAWFKKLDVLAKRVRELEKKQEELMS